MENKIFTYHFTVKEIYLDLFGHMNNATYLTILEDSRWDLLTQNGFTVADIQRLGIGPTILEINIRYLRELRLRDEVVIETKLVSYEKKIGKILQHMKRGEEVCCTAEFTIALFDLKQRKIINATPEWLQALGVST